MQFTWDPKKAAANRRKHNITFEEAISVFSDPHASIFADPDHSVPEHREIIVGLSRKSLLVVCLPNARELSVSLALGTPQREKENAMKKTARKTLSDDVRAEYAFDYSTAKPNRFASTLEQTSIVVLDPDVAAVFTSSKAVNNLLRSAIRATGKSPAPAKKKSAAVRGRRHAA